MITLSTPLKIALHQSMTFYKVPRSDVNIKIVYARGCMQTIKPKTVQFSNQVCLELNFQTKNYQKILYTSRVLSMFFYLSIYIRYLMNPECSGVYGISTALQAYQTGNVCLCVHFFCLFSTNIECHFMLSSAWLPHPLCTYMYIDHWDSNQGL